MSAKRKGKRRSKAPSKGAMRRRAKARGVLIADVMRSLRAMSRVRAIIIHERARIQWLNLTGGAR